MRREVLYSPGFGAGWATWNTEYGKALAEDEQLVALVRADQHRGQCPSLYGPPHECSQAFLDRAVAIARSAGAPDDWAPYCGGVRRLQIEVVDGPYRIDEYDGSESVVQASAEEWW